MPHLTDVGADCLAATAFLEWHDSPQSNMDSTPRRA